jgi:hypothetical protein
VLLARPPYQLSRQVSQEDKGPPPPAAAPPPSPGLRRWGQGPPSWPGAGAPPSAPSARSVLGTVACAGRRGLWGGVPTRPSRLRSVEFLTTASSVGPECPPNLWDQEDSPKLECGPQSGRLFPAPRKPGPCDLGSVSQGFFHVPRDSQTGPPQSPPGPRFEVWGKCEPWFNPNILAQRFCQLGGSSEKVFKIWESSERPPKSEGSRENLTGTAPEPWESGRSDEYLKSSFKGLRPQTETPKGRSPNSSPERAGGEGDKGGAGSLRLAGKGPEGSGLTSWLLGGRAARPRVGVPGAPLAGGSGVRGCLRICSVSPRVPPHRVRLPGVNVERAGAGPRTPLPSASWMGGPCAERGCGVPSPARPLGRRRRRYSYYCTSLRYISFQNSTPRTHNAPRLKGAADASRLGGGGGGGRLKGQRGSPDFRNLPFSKVIAIVGCTLGPSPKLGGASLLEEKGSFPDL